MTKQECLNTLGLSSDASNDDIKKAYRKLANKHHPDKEGGDNELFAKISEAYRCLKKNEFDVGANGRRHYYNNAAGHGREEDISSVFEEFVRRASRGNGTEYDFGGFEDLFRQTRSHMVKTYAIDLKTVYHGGDVETDLGQFRIPAGVHTNTIMSVFDTDVKFKLIADDKFKRVRDNSADLVVLATVSSINLITGVTATLRHLSGNTIEIDIPKGTEINKVLRVKGQGLPVFNKSGQYGDLYVKLDVYTPKNLGVMQTKKLKKMFNSKIEI